MALFFIAIFYEGYIPDVSLTAVKESIMSLLATTSTPPYYAVIFTLIRTKQTEGYMEIAQKC
ncbi:hypothetical protein [Shewanella sp. HN-41]|uniref:hypothetical protein n=1 Tax=Shewanella sp. HN-41 TaxID=327275 RepID=UPI00021259FE|nr:hypothetical protein [Shewanella sp. HN-41]EGM71056.1 hypothetical protein SOHN41_00790 [Shewanella sp. HN-41]